MSWSPDSICLGPHPSAVEAVAADLYQRTCRTDFNAPGFCLLNVGPALESTAFRQLMVDLKKEMAAIHEAKTGDTLIYLSAARFDQQTTTKPHRDGGPEQSMLMLGYEPSDVAAELEIYDYSQCAFDHGMSPQQLMIKHNPIFQSGAEVLRPYCTRIPCFSQTDYQIVCINNSSAPFSREQPTWQGTLHTATILEPDESKRRVVNSTLIAPAPAGTLDAVSAAEQQEFITTSLVRRRGYDKLHLDDDA